MDSFRPIENQAYQKFITELSICHTRRRFLVLYQDRNIINFLIERLKQKFPRYETMRFPSEYSQPLESRQHHLQAHNIRDFFDSVSRPVSRQESSSYIFHVTDIELIPPEFQSDFINYFNHISECMEPSPCFLIFWIPAHFEKQLCLSALNFHGFETCDFTRMRAGEGKKAGDNKKEKSPDKSEAVSLTPEAIFQQIRDSKGADAAADCPFLQDMIVKALPFLENESPLNIFHVYRSYTHLWIYNDEHESDSSAEKQSFLWKLAQRSLKKERNVSEPSEAPPDIDTCKFLKADKSGKYDFVHGSFADYFLAQYYVDLVRNQKDRTISYAAFNPAARTFFKLILSSEKQDLSHINLSGLNLDDACFTESNFVQSAFQKTSFSHTDLSHADFREADLTKAGLQQAKLCHALLEQSKLTSANLTQADLTEAQLAKANLQRACLNKANLTRANLQQAILSDAEAVSAGFQQADLNKVDFRWANADSADFSKAVLTEVNFLKTTLTKADFSEANLQRANLNDADLTYANLTSADLRTAKLNKTNLTGANFTSADLTDANLWKANLNEANLSGANLSGANLNKADLYGANLSGADIRGADFWQANLTDVDLTDAVYDEAFGEMYLGGKGM